MRSKYLFLDERHISAGQLAWQTADGRHVPLLAPQEPATRAFATGPQSVPTGVRLVVQPARRTDPFAVPADMQRLGGASYPLVSHEEGRYTWRFFQTTYRTDDDLGAYTKVRPASRDVCCLESPDGFAWTETSRCPVEEFGQQGQDGGGFLIDPHGPAEQRYKGIYVSRPPKEQARELWERYRTLPRRHRDERARADLLFCVYAVTSPDGRDWQTHRTPLMTGIHDHDFSLYHDAELARYVLYTRLNRNDRRCIARAEASDFWDWGHPETIIHPGLHHHLSEDIYLNGRTSYPGHDDYHLMFATRYHRATEGGRVVLHCSDDGILWKELPESPVLDTGHPSAVDRWDSGWLYVLKGLVPLDGDKVAVPYLGTPYPHKYPRWKQVVAGTQQFSWAWWEADRLVAVRADELGRFCSRPVVPAGRTLRINARTGLSGYVRVGIEARPADPEYAARTPDPDPAAGTASGTGRPIASCRPLSGDCRWRTVDWSGQTDINVADDTPVTLRFELRHADLFGFEWAA